MGVSNFITLSKCIIASLTFVPLTFCVNNPIFAQDKNDKKHIVSEGETLSLIAEKMYADYKMWNKIYMMNKEKINNPDLIYPGQTLILPSISDKNKPDSTQNDIAKSDIDSMQTDSAENAMLEKFREAFKSVASGDDEEKSEPEKTKSQQEQEDHSYQGVAISGLILDETRSKIGGDFYDLFYSHWEKPEEIDDFIIKISERTIPSTGVVVSIKIDRDLVFQRRIEPRYYATEQAAKKAVSVCQRALQKKKLNINDGYQGI